MQKARRNVLKTIAGGAALAALTPSLKPALAFSKRSMFDPITIGSLNIKNRIFKAATSMDMADEHGLPTPEYLAVYEEAAKGGPGLIITDVTFVNFDDRPSHADLSIHDAAQIPAFAKLAETIQNNGAKACLQIGWAGSMTVSKHRVGERKIWGPSEVKHPLTGVTSSAITKEEIKEVVRTMAQAARRAKAAGFDAVELHFVHNFMLSQFLTPYYNKRTDEYGGSIENRTRLHFEILEAVRKEVGTSYPVFAKIHGKDYLPKQGMTLEEGIFLAKGLEKRGITALELSGGNLVNGPETMPWRPEIEDGPTAQSYFAKDALQYDRAVNVPLILTGGNRRIDVMEEILNTTPDIVAFGLSRTLLSEPDLPNKWSKDPEATPQCISCNECIINYGTGPTACVLV